MQKSFQNPRSSKRNLRMCPQSVKLQAYKEVFVKHEQAPTAPKLEEVWFFVEFKYIFYENRYFGQFDNFRSGFFLPKCSKGTPTDQDQFNVLQKWRCTKINKT